MKVLKLKVKTSAIYLNGNPLPLGSDVYGVMFNGYFMIFNSSGYTTWSDFTDFETSEEINLENKNQQAPSLIGSLGSKPSKITIEF